MEMFRRAVRRGRLSHGFLFHGEDGIGKRTFARMLAQCLFCSRIEDDELDACGECSSCRQMQAGSHPDLLEVGCPKGKSIIPIELIAGHRGNRGREGLCHDIALRPMCGDRRIAIIDDADRFNDESGNALLKTLEEPPDYATLILISSDLDQMLPTIRSRCQHVRFSPLTDDDIAAILLSEGLVDSADEAATIAAMSDGSLATASQLLQPELRSLRKLIHDTLARGDFNTADTATAVMEAVEACGDTAAQRVAVHWVVRFCLDYYRQQLRGSRQSLETVGRLIDRSSEATQHVEANVQVSLCVQSLFDDLSRLARTG